MSVFRLLLLLLSPTLVYAERDPLPVRVSGSVYLEEASEAVFRGRVVDGSQETFGVDVSAFGFTALLERSKNSVKESANVYQFSYTYALNSLRFSLGVQQIDPIVEAEEWFFEVRGAWSILETRVAYQAGLDKFEHEHFELETAIPWSSKAGTWMASPYFVLSYGDYYGSGSTLTHMEVGSDVTYRVTDNLSVSAFARYVMPKQSVESSGFDESEEFGFGALVKYEF